MLSDSRHRPDTPADLDDCGAGTMIRIEPASRAPARSLNTAMSAPSGRSSIARDE